MAVLGLCFCARAFSSCGKQGPLFIAVCGPLTIAACLVAEHRLQTCRLSNCGSQAQLLCGMWDLPRPGLEPVFPALAGRLSTTAPPGKPSVFVFVGPFLLLCFPLREAPLAFVVEVVWWCWILLAFACLICLICLSDLLVWFACLICLICLSDLICPSNLNEIFAG